jgi:eukaryotic-like serine/threonine-protein kinase
MIGQTLAVKYEISAQISDSPVFTMFSARDRLSGRSVGIRQIKMPFNSEPEFVSSIVSLLPEIQTNHPNVEALYEVVEDSGQHYIISELPKGSHLTERIKRFAPFTVPVTLATVVGVVEALDALHTQGIAHGDVGPHNIIATHDGSAKLQLAGIWKAYSSSRSAGVAVLAQMAPYLAPEVCTGQKPSATSDLYSVGVILFELLTGRVPHHGETPSATTMRHLTSPVPSLRGINASVPVAVEQVVQRLLLKDPTKRYQSARELLAELRAIGDQLRFGRTPVAKPPEKGQEVVVEPIKPIRVTQRRTPKQEPISREDKIAARKRKRQERDVPSWGLALLGLLVLTVTGLIVAVVMYLAQKPREVKVPNLKGVFTKSANEQVRNLKLTIRVAGKESNERIEIGKILRTNPDAGEMIREGGTINVYESSGTKLVKVPDLFGMTADEAKAALESENLSIDGKPLRLTDYKNAAGTIIKQVPDPNEKVSRTSKVQIWIAAPSDAPQGSLPGEGEGVSDNPARSFQLTYRVKGVRWRVSVKIDFEDDNGKRMLKESDYDPGDTIPIKLVGHGKSGTFTIYFDGELKDTIEVKPGEKATN